MSRSLFALLNRRYGPKVDRVTRREMLQATLATGAALLVSNRVGFPQDGKAATKPSGKRVVVVGAGFSGLACAFELMSAGYDVTVVEARARVSGRVVSFGDFVAGKNVEGGGELIGSNHPTWVAYKEKFGLQFLDVTESEDESPIVLNGKRLSADAAEKLWKEMEAALSRMNADAAAVDADLPWKSPNAAALDGRTTASWIAALEASADCKAAIAAQLTGDNGVAVARQSYLGNLAAVKGGGLEKFWTESEVYRSQGGNQQLAQKLAGALGEKRLRLGAAVRSIQLAEQGARVKLAKGDLLECDDVVLTAPPATWSKIAFEPALPAALKPQSGPVTKWLMSLQGRFWKEAKLSPDGLTDGAVSLTWDLTDGQPAEGGAGMVAFSGGTAAEICRAWPAASRDESFLAEVARLYPDVKKSFQKARFMDWPSDVWTSCGYSFPAPGEVTTVGPLLREGVGGRLHFAGEHASYAFIGYMEGALNSGAALANRLAKRDGVAQAK